MKKLLFLSFFSIGLSLHAQMLHLKNGSFIPTSNIQDIKNFNNWKEYEFNNQVYCIIQFNKATSLNERKIIESETGIQFFDYFPKWAFLATIPKNISKSALENRSIRAIVPMQATAKIDKKLIEKPFPNWIVKQNGAIEILVDIYSTINQNEVLNSFAQKNIQFINWKNKHTAIVQINENKLSELASIPWVKYLQPISAPAELENLTERTNHRVNTIDASYASGLHHDGTGVSVSIGDDGQIGPHIDFKGRIINHANLNTTSNTHADHVAGIVGGGGNFNPISSGNGRGADLHIYDYYDNLTNAPTDYNTAGVRILTNSLGQGCNAGYNNDAQDMDLLIRSNQSLLSIHSSGNSGGSSCGGNSQGFFTITGGYKSGKNAIATGNITNDDALAPSSSKGPSEDGRLKPEIVATGTDVFSTQPNNTYDSFTGTSMACPGVAGTLASLYQAYRVENAGADPYSALMKTLLLNTADDLGTTGPDFKFGFGRINARRAYNAMKNQQYIIDSIDNGNIKNYLINVPSNVSQMKVMCYWHDIEGNPASSLVLVNDINISIENTNGVTFLPLVLNNANNNIALNSVATQNIDSLNNSEQIVIDLPQGGGYLLHVNGFNIPQGPQKFVIAYEFLTDSVTLIYPQGGESFANGVTERIRWDAYNNNLGTFKLEYSANAGTTWNTISSTIQADKRYYDWTPPSNLNTGKMLMRVTRGSISDVSDTLFTVLGVPTNLMIDTACGSTFHLKWDALAGAEGYTIYQLGTKYMDSIGTSTTNDFYVSSGTNNIDTFYFAVAATKLSNGAKGLRTIAIRYINVNSIPMVTATSSATTVCAGTSVTLTGGGANTYTWSGGVTNGVSFVPTATTTYTVTGTNAAGCTAQTTIIIAVSPNIATPTSVVTANATCIPGCDGIVTMNPSTGLVYSLSPAPNIPIVGNIIGGLCVGTTYTVTGTDASGCSVTTTISVGQQTGPAISVLSTTNASCSPGCDGTATMNNVPNMVYTISPAVIPAIVGNNISGLCSGVLYTITGTSNLNVCTSTTTVQVGTLNGPAAPTVVSSTPASCNPGCDGTLLFNSAVALTYDFTPAGPTAVGNNVSGLCAGTTYTVTGADAAGCIVQTTIQIGVSPNPAAPTSVVTTNATCNPGCDGVVTMAQAIGLVYSLSPAPNIPIVGNIIGGLCVGTTYTVTGTDTSGCSVTTTISVGQQTAPAISVSTTTNASCSPVCDGTATMNNVPNMVYTISPSVIPAIAGNNISGLCSGTIYTITGTSTVNGCTSTQTIIVNALPTVTANASATSVCTGTSVTLTGGGANTYTWSGGVANGVSFVPTATTTYTVTGTNAAGCSNTATQTITVNALPTVTANASATNVCTGNSITLTGGGASTYTWSGGVTNGVSFVPTVTTTYTVTGTDVNGCKNTASKTINMNILPTLVISASKKLYCQTDASGILTGNPVGGVWSGVGVSGNTFNPTVAGLGSFYAVYTFTATNGCTNKDSLLMTVSTCLGIEEAPSANLFSVYPNPTTSEINVKTDVQLIDSDFVLYDNAGNVLRRGKIKSANTLIKLSDFSAGVYYFTVSNKLYGKQSIKVIKE